MRDETKYERMIAFGAGAAADPRGASTRDLARPGLPREKVLADGRAPAGRDDADPRRQRGVRARERLLRPDDAAQRATSTSTARRVALPLPRQERQASTTSTCTTARAGAGRARAARICPGQELFQYLDDDGEPADVDSDDVNDYLREITGEDFTAKDFRTWAGTVLAAWALDGLGEAGSPAQAKRNVVRAVESVAKELGNTPAVCRNCYVHPDVIEAHLEGSLTRALGRKADRRVAQGMRGLTAQEAAVLALLRRRLAAEARRR